MPTMTKTVARYRGMSDKFEGSQLAKALASKEIYVYMNMYVCVHYTASKYPHLPFNINQEKYNATLKTEPWNNI